MLGCFFLGGGGGLQKFWGGGGGASGLGGQGLYPLCIPCV